MMLDDKTGEERREGGALLQILLDMLQQNKQKMDKEGYEEFKKMPQDKRTAMIEEQKQSDPKPIPEFKPFPDMNFIELVGSQHKHPIKLATYRYPAEKTKGVVIYFHTMCYHQGLIVNFARTFADNGFTFVGYDQRGHGKSEGEKGYLEDVNQVLKDADNFIGAIFKMYPNTPVFLMGHGLGGLLSITIQRDFKQYKFAGILLTSPALKKPSGKVISAISDVAFKLMPNKAGLFALNFDLVCKNPAASAYLKSDPLIYHDKVCVGTLTQMMVLMDKNDEKYWSKYNTCPIIIVQAQMDKVADPMNSIKLYEQMQTKDKQYIWKPNMWNNFFFEEESEEIQKTLVKWLSEKV